MPRKKILTDVERKFARLIAQGVKQGEALRQAKDLDEITNSVSSQASQWVKRPYIQEQVARIRDNLQIGDIDNAGQAWSQLMGLIEETIAAKNYNAAAQLMRQRLQGLGLMKDQLTVINTTDDKQLIDRITNGDSVKAEQLRIVLDSDTFDGDTVQ